MLQHVDYRTSADTGEIDSASIAPVADGEAAKQLIFRRPTENNRTRLEVLRDTEREHLLLRDAVPNALWGGGTVTFNGAKPTYSGIFTISADMYISPFQTAGDGVGSAAPYIGSTRAALTLGTTGVNQLFITSVKKQFESTTFMKADANRISVEILHDTSTSIVLEGASGEVNNIKITIISGTTTVQQLVDLINNDVTVTQYVTATKEGTTPGGAAAPLWGPTQWGSDYGRRFLKGGMSGITHKITAANLSAFFATTANTLQKGDSIAIWYDKMVDKTGVGGRMQSTPENGNTTIPTASIFNTRVNPEYIPGCVPICKCLDDNTLLFVDGTYFARGVAGVLGGGKGAELGSLATPLGWDRMGTGPDWNPPTNIRQALDNADGHIDNILDEIEAARSSTVFGAQANVDARLEKSDGHVRHFISVGPGGMYTDLQTALLAHGRSSVGGDGAVFLVRQGTYLIDTPIAFDQHVEIIATESDTIIAVATGGTTYAFTFAAGVRSSKSRISGFLVQNVSGSGCFVDIPGKAVVLENIQAQISGSQPSEPFIRVSGSHVDMRNVHIETGGQDYAYFTSTSRDISVTNFYGYGSSGSSFIIEGQRFHFKNIQLDSGSPVEVVVTAYLGVFENFEIKNGQGTSAQMIVQGSNIGLRNIRIQAPGDQLSISSSYRVIVENYDAQLYGVAAGYLAISCTGTQCILRNIEGSSLTGGARLIYMTATNMLENVQVSCSPSTDTANAIIYCQGIQLQVRNIRFSSNGSQYQPLLYVNGTGTVESIDVDMGIGTASYTAKFRNPVTFRSYSTGHLDVFSVNFRNVGFLNDYTFYRDCPLIVLYPDGANSRVLLDGGTVEGCSATGTPTVLRTGYIIGSTSSAYVPEASGSIVIRNFDFDVGGINYHGAWDEFVCVCNLPRDSEVSNCTFIGIGGSAAWCIVARGAEGYKILNNNIYAFGDNLPALILVRDSGSGYNANYSIVSGNTLHHGAGRLGVIDMISISGYDGTYPLMRPRVTDNVCIKYYASGWTGASIRFDYVDKGTVFHNNVSNGITYSFSAVNMLPAVGALGTHNILA